MSRILLVCHQFFPRFYTGTEVLVLETADELKRRGHTVEIMTFEPYLPGDTFPKEPKLVVEEYEGHVVKKIITCNVNSNLDRLYKESNDDSLTIIYTSILDEFKPDICHVFHLMRSTYSFATLLFERRIKSFFTSTDYWMLCPTYQLLFKDQYLCSGPKPGKCFSCLGTLYCRGMKVVPLKLKLGLLLPRIASLFNHEVREMMAILKQRIILNQDAFSKFDHVFMSNNFMKELFSINNYKNVSNSILAFPIPKRAKENTVNSILKKREKLNVGFIGTLRESKGPQILIEACNKLKSKELVNVHIWGAAIKPDFMASLEKESEGLDFVNFRGTFNQGEFANVLSELDVVVIPSTWYENTPLTALSVMDAKRVLIVSNMGGLSSLVVDRKTGFIFENRDSKKLASIIDELALNRELLIDVANNVDSPIDIVEYVTNLESKYFDKTIEKVD